MAKKSSRIKAASSPAFVPQSELELIDAVRRIGEAQRDVARLQTDMNDEMASIKEAWEARAKPLQQLISELSHGAQIFCEANRSALTNGGKVKSATLPTGEIAWRIRPPSVRITGQDAVLDALRRAKLGRFIRQKEEVNKEAILNEPKAVSNVPGISIQQGEDFVITPFEVELSGEGK